jgi:hypothetical protein
MNPVILSVIHHRQNPLESTSILLPPYIHVRYVLISPISRVCQIATTVSM